MECVPEPSRGDQGSVRGCGSARLSGAAGPRVGKAGRRGKVRLGQMQPLHPPPVLCTLMQMHWPEWFISSMWNGIMHPHPISLMKKREPAPGTKLPTLGECSGSAVLGRGAPPFLPFPSFPSLSLHRPGRCLRASSRPRGAGLSPRWAPVAPDRRPPGGTAGTGGWRPPVPRRRCPGVGAGRSDVPASLGLGARSLKD